MAAWTLAATAAALELPATDAFGEWQARQQGGVEALAAHLEAQGLHAVLPLPELLRSASSWAECDDEPWGLPPPAQWPSVVSVLRLVQALKAEGAIARIEVRSGYRHPALNACAGGAPRSAHQRLFALDFVVHEPADAFERLCTFWRTQGPVWRMGFSRYPSGRIHVDTAGWRTWGADHGRATTACPPLEPEPGPDPAASPR